MTQLSDDCFAFGGPLMRIEEAVALMAARVNPVTGTETLPLVAAAGRVLAGNLAAILPLPPFFNSAVDGYAVRHADLAAIGPTRLPVAGRVPAGTGADGITTAGQAIRIFTGAPMPPGADTVFMQEDVTAAGGAVVLPAGLRRGANCRLAGEDLASGAAALPAGRLLGPADLALAAAAGHARLTVCRRVRVAVFSTGNELREAGEPLAAAEIPDANRVMLMALLAGLGCEVSDLGILRDEPAGMARRLAEAAARHDLILTSGGVSTGEEDHVKTAVESVGRLVFWRIAVKPGRPVAMGVIAGSAFVGLPGNPVAVYVTFTALVRPLVRLLAGAVVPEPRPLPVRLAFAYRKKAGRREFVRVTLRDGADGVPEAVKHPRDGAGIITSLTESDGLVTLSEDLTDVPAGTVAPFTPFALLR
jgi:molybdopterin molybdotransferase